MMKPLIMLSLISVAAPATAQITFEPAPVASPAQNTSKANDQDRIICERQEQIGSRLGGKKVCKTAAQWQEERRTIRNDVERVQQVVNQTPSG